MIYGGAQKNLAPAGFTFVIVKNDALGKVERPIPSMLDYNIHINGNSMFNTPSCVSIYAALHTLRWYKKLGGVEAMHKINIDKADLIYSEILRNKMFVPNILDEADRSIMNVTFVMSEDYKDKEASFMELASSKGIIGIKGHRSVGGFRASIYNAMPIESVRVLTDAMKEFESKN